MPYSTIPRAQSGPSHVTGIPAGLTPMRITETVHYNQTGIATDSTSNNPSSYWNTTAPNSRNVVLSVDLKNGAGTPFSRTEIEYDNYSTTANPEVVRAWDSTKGAVSTPLTDGNSVKTPAEYANAAAFRFAQSIATGTWTPLTLPGELDVARVRSDSGIRPFPHPQLPEVNAGDRVNYRILPPPRKKR